jgi:hypothetical protein
MDSMFDGSHESFQWVSAHWWSGDYELRAGPAIVASLRVRGSSATAETSDGTYRIVRVRLPAYLTMNDEEQGDLIARVCLIPSRGFLAEFSDGESFHLGWLNWWKREWSWTNGRTEPVLRSRHSFWGNATEVSLEPPGFSERKVSLLAILERSISAVSAPFF